MDLEVMSRSNIAALVPEINLDTYSYLYGIENGLRELIIERLALVAGPRWHRERIPGDLMNKCKEAFKGLRRIPWEQYVPYHTIYYIDFAELRKIIERDDNWRDAFHAVFGRRETFVATLAGLEPIRNNIAHNRRVSKLDFQIAKTAYDQIEAAVGATRFKQLVSTATAATELPDIMTSLLTEAEVSAQACLQYTPLPPRVSWNKMRDAWWFDDSYLLHDVGAIEGYFRLLEAYSCVPRGRGTGHLIEEWVQQNALSGQFCV
jgi:hypothetical protein